MPSWRKLLSDMLADSDPRSYTYDQGRAVLENLGFTLAKPTSGSHRKFRLVTADTADPERKRTIIVGLVDKGHGTLKPVYIRELVRVLRENHLLPEGVENSHDRPELDE